MNCFVRFISLMLILSGIESEVVLAETDSLRVNIVNTTKPAGKTRFIMRDSSNLILRVMDEAGDAFTDLNADQVEIFRGTEPAKIIKVTPLQLTVETNLNMVLALDNSSSMYSSVKELLMSVRLLLDNFRGRSRVSVVLFDEHKYTPDKFKGEIDGEPLKVKFYNFTQNLDSVMNYIRWNYRSSLTARTYLYDEILVALKQFEKLPPNLLRVMIILSDGDDLGSKFKYRDALEAASNSGITIYGIDYSRSSEISEFIKQISSATPMGKVFKAEKATDLIPVFEALTKEIITEFQVTYHFPIPPSGAIQFTSDSLTITKRRLTDEFPMLNYAFFDSNSAEIDQRYLMFSSSQETGQFDETSIQKPLDKYYHLLNIIGSRTKRDSLARLTLTGCNMNSGAEKGNLSLSRKRAQAVSQYLQDIWGIDTKRIKIVTRNLPEKPSSKRTREGQAENRRVEITANHYEILRPIRSEVTEYLYQPEIGYFNTQINAPEGLKQWRFYAHCGADQLVELDYQQKKSEITWNWINNSGEKIQGPNSLNYGIKITDLDGRSFESPSKTLPVSLIDEATGVAEIKQDSVFEKFSLVLFDFNSSRVGVNNQNLMQKVLSIYMAHPNASLKIQGYCDDIGKTEYNLKLSTKRAKIAHDLLKRMGVPKEKLAYQGYGEINPIFSNATPEGRFLNRTVQIYIGYPKE